jgi:uncharacterized OB-fold protein
MSLTAPYTVEFPFQRTVGSKVGTFLGGLRDARLFGVRTPRGVLCPPLEFDPVTGAETGELVELEPVGTVTTWTRVPSHDVAWALIAIDGTVGTLLHAVEADGLRVGLRVRARWRPSRVGSITDIECFEAVP